MNPHRSLFSQHPLAQLAVAFSAGICAANYLPHTVLVGCGSGVFDRIAGLCCEEEDGDGGGGVVAGDVLCGPSAGGVGETI